MLYNSPNRNPSNHFRIFVGNAGIPCEKGAVLPIASPDIYHRIINVLRLTVGESIVLFNSKGESFVTEIVDHEKWTDSIKFKILSREKCVAESILDIELGQAVIKNNKFDLIVQKAVELGVRRVTSVVTEFSEGHSKFTFGASDSKSNNKLDRLQKIAIQAVEQCGRCYVPTIDNQMKLKDWIERLCEKECVKILFHPYAEHSLCLDSAQRELRSIIRQVGNRVAILIGPEGGLSEKDINACRSAGFMEYSLGSSILRAETAAIVAVFLMTHII